MRDAIIDKIQINNFKSLNGISDNTMLVAQNEFLINMAEHWITRAQQLDCEIVRMQKENDELELLNNQFCNTVMDMNAAGSKLQDENVILQNALEHILSNSSWLPDRKIAKDALDKIDKTFTIL